MQKYLIIILFFASLAAEAAAWAKARTQQVKEKEAIELAAKAETDRLTRETAAANAARIEAERLAREADARRIRAETDRLGREAAPATETPSRAISPRRRALDRSGVGGVASLFASRGSAVMSTAPRPVEVAGDDLGGEPDPTREEIQRMKRENLTFAQIIAARHSGGVAARAGAGEAPAGAPGDLTEAEQRQLRMGVPLQAILNKRVSSPVGVSAPISMDAMLSESKGLRRVEGVVEDPETRAKREALAKVQKAGGVGGVDISVIAAAATARKDRAAPVDIEEQRKRQRAAAEAERAAERERKDAEKTAARANAVRVAEAARAEKDAKIRAEFAGATR